MKDIMKKYDFNLVYFRFSNDDEDNNILSK